VEHFSVCIPLFQTVIGFKFCHIVHVDLYCLTFREVYADTDIVPQYQT